jgi:carboxymethylenebutenolidase
MSKTITLSVKDANEMNAYVAMPEGAGPFPAIMVFQEAFGVNGHIKNIADKLAVDGYVAVAPELFHRTAEPGETFSYSDFPSVMPHFQAITTEGLVNDTQAVYDWMQAQDNVKKDKIGAVGFCLGGRVAFIANTAVKLAASAAFYGGGMHTVADRTDMASGPQLLFWGGKDTHITPDHVEAVVKAFKDAGKDYINVVIAAADHAFACEDRPNYNHDAATEAWAMTDAFFKNKLG